MRAVSCWHQILQRLKQRCGKRSGASLQRGDGNSSHCRHSIIWSRGLGITEWPGAISEPVGARKNWDAVTVLQGILGRRAAAVTPTSTRWVQKRQPPRRAHVAPDTTATMARQVLADAVCEQVDEHELGNDL